MSIPERNMFRARRLDNGEWVQGYYYPLFALECNLTYIEDYEEDIIVNFSKKENGKIHAISTPIDPATLEPVPMKPIPKNSHSMAGAGDEWWECPNCGNNEIGCCQFDYCYNCGQRLDWNDNPELRGEME